MADALKTFFSAQRVKRLADEVARVWPAFPVRAFVAGATHGLDALELVDRAKHISRVLAAHLPARYPEALDVLMRSLGPELAGDELLGVGMAPFFYLPHALFIAERGLEHFDLSMRAQAELTKRFTCESSVRPYIAADPARAFAFLRRWAKDPNPHVRRLVSEGTRLRLPWASRVAWLDEHPERVVELLELLKDDPASLVRRSVANNLNDLGKLHPALLIRTCTAWLSDERRALIEHALRSAVKRGMPQALELLGYGGRPSVALAAVRIEPARVRIGENVRVGFTLKSTAKRAQELLVDLAVHFVKANGAATPKVFKVGRVKLAPKGSVALRSTVSLKVHTTRKPNPGSHAVDVVINGEVLRAGSFVVRGSARGRQTRAV